MTNDEAGGEQDDLLNSTLAGEISTLTQYMGSIDYMERFLEAAHTPEAGVALTPVRPGFKLASPGGLIGDQLAWFVDRKPEFEAEFQALLVGRIGEEKTKRFFELLATRWIKGGSNKREGEILDLIESVANYARAVWTSDAPIVQLPIAPGGVPFLDQRDVALILSANDQMLQSTIDDWLEVRPNGAELGRDEVFVSRGLALKKSMRDRTTFSEYGFLSSYTLAISISEQFCRAQPGLAAMVHTEIDTFQGRVLFFSPFIPGMNGTQFELGVIPGSRPDRLAFQMEHSGVEEYRLGDLPEDISA